MTENRTLGDFGGDGGDDDDSTARESPVDAEAAEPTEGDAEAAEPTEGDAEAVEPTEADDAATAETAPVDPDGVEAATVTYSWSPDGDACAECGGTVEKRWRAGEGSDDPDAMVCPECKQW